MDSASEEKPAAATTPDSGQPPTAKARNVLRLLADFAIVIGFALALLEFFVR